MQLICKFDLTDFDSWKRAFDADDEARRQAGLSVLQIWRVADDTERALVLLNVNDRARAKEWINRSDALQSDDGGTVTNATHHFVRTV